MVSTKGKNTRITAKHIETTLLGIGTVVGGAAEGMPFGAVGSFQKHFLLLSSCSFTTNTGIGSSVVGIAAWRNCSGGPAPLEPHAVTTEPAFPIRRGPAWVCLLSVLKSESF